VDRLKAAAPRSEIRDLDPVIDAMRVIKSPRENLSAFVPIEIEVAGDLARWRANIPGKVDAQAEALTGPTTLPGQRIQTINPPGSEVGPNAVATWGTAVMDRVTGFGFDWKRSGQSSKHIPFSWNGPD